jgi:hypothetical protein
VSADDPIETARERQETIADHANAKADARVRIELEFAAEHIADNFVDVHRGHLRALLLEWDDTEAAAKLQRLRDVFWKKAGDV